jgi:hypothetical protein
MHKCQSVLNVLLDVLVVCSIPSIDSPILLTDRVALFALGHIHMVPLMQFVNLLVLQALYMTPCMTLIV